MLFRSAGCAPKELLAPGLAATAATAEAAARSKGPRRAQEGKPARQKQQQQGKAGCRSSRPARLREGAWALPLMGHMAWEAVAPEPSVAACLGQACCAALLLGWSQELWLSCPARARALAAGAPALGGAPQSAAGSASRGAGSKLACLGSFPGSTKEEAGGKRAEKMKQALPRLGKRSQSPPSALRHGAGSS